jgi:hypothetical protein
MEDFFAPHFFLIEIVNLPIQKSNSGATPCPVYGRLNMPVVMAYMVLESTTKQALEEAVREALSQGWQPLGGVCIAEGIYYQAMIGA